MYRFPFWNGLLSCFLVLSISLLPILPPVHAAPASLSGDRDQGKTQGDDPCTHLPDPPGNANGIHKRCPDLGSSSGIAKGDFNNDGYADLAIGEPGATISGQAGAGDVIILYGSANGLTITGEQLFYEGRTPGVAVAGDNFGAALASGDFNGDGFSDLAIGVPGKTDDAGIEAGAVIIIYGSPNGLTTTDSNRPAPQFFHLGMATLPPLCTPVPLVEDCPWNLNGARLGTSLAWGDFNNDGKGDLAIGAPGLTPTCFGALCPLSLEFSQIGGIWEIFGSGARLSLGGNRVFTAALTFNVATVIESDFGAVLAAGDFNGDHFSDLAIGAPNSDLIEGFGAARAGMVTVLPGSSSGLTATGSQIWLENSPGVGEASDNNHFGTALAAGDFNGDGKVDLAIGTPEEGIAGTGFTFFDSAGEVYILNGSSGGLSAAGQHFTQASLGGANQSGARFGAALVSNDFNDDGKADLAVGIPLQDVVVSGTTLADAGQVDVIFGSSTGLSTAGHAPQILHNVNGIHAGDRFGAPLTAWNFGQDEVTGFFPNLVVKKIADLVVGAPSETVNKVSGAGAISVFYGSFNSNGLLINGAQMFTADSIGLGGQTGAHFGAGLY